MFSRFRYKDSICKICKLLVALGIAMYFNAIGERDNMKMGVEVIKVMGSEFIFSIRRPCRDFTTNEDGSSIYRRVTLKSDIH